MTIIECPMCKADMIRRPGTFVYECPGCKAQLTVDNLREFPSPLDVAKETFDADQIDPDTV